MSTIEEAQPRNPDGTSFEEKISTEGESKAKSGLVGGPKLVVIIALAAFLTDIGQTARMGRQPIQYLLHHYMHANATTISNYFFYSAFAWYLKPIAGLISDAFPLFGTRRRSYLLLSAILSAVFWSVMAFVPKTYAALLGTGIVLNVAMMFASMAMGAMLVEYGKSQGATGRLSSLREGLANVSLFIVGPVSGWLASQQFGLTVGLCTTLMVILAIGTYVFLQENRSAEVDKEVWSRAGQQLRNLGRSWPLWSAAIMMAFIFLAPGVGTLTYVRQTDVLQFTQQHIGILGLLGGIGGIAGALTYGWLCKRISLRPLLVIGIILNAVSGLIYLKYNSWRLAEMIDATNGYLFTIGVLAVYDLAARATPTGGEGLGFALMMAVRNFALFFSDKLGSQFSDQYHLPYYFMVKLNAGFTICALLLVPIIPRLLTDRRDAPVGFPPGAEPATEKLPDAV